MNNQEIVNFLNNQWPPSVQTFQGHATSFDQENAELNMTFTTHPGFCHSGDIVQGGFITSMLDAVMAYTAIGMPDDGDNLATLEIKVSFLRVARNGAFTGIGKIIHAGKSIAYLEGQLFQNGKLVATGSSTVKLLRRR